MPKVPIKFCSRKTCEDGKLQYGQKAFVNPESQQNPFLRDSEKKKKNYKKGKKLPKLKMKLIQMKCKRNHDREFQSISHLS